MLYAAVRPIAKVGLTHYFRRIDLANVDRIPRDGAVILAANHPTTFIEPCIMACFQDRPLHFLARGDFFKHPTAAKLLAGVHIIPIFRLRDGGFQGVKSNYESFDRSFDVLAQKKTMMILAEGRCIHEKRLRPIQKGTARIALGALDATPLDEVYIVPVGVNYTYADRLRSDVMINFGEPIRASAYMERYRESPAQAIADFTDDLHRRLSEEVIIVERIEDEPLVENLLRVFRTEYPATARNTVTHDEQFLRGEKRIADAVNAMPEAERGALAARSHDYFSRLERMRIDDAAFAGRYRPAQQRTARTLLGLLPALLLLLWHLPPLLLAQWLAGVKIKTLEFAGSVRWAAVLVLYLVYTLLWVAIPLITGHWWWLALPALGLGLTGQLIRYAEDSHRWLLAWRARRQAEHEVKYLRQLRKGLVEEVARVVTV